MKAVCRRHFMAWNDDWRRITMMVNWLRHIVRMLNLLLLLMRLLVVMMLLLAIVKSRLVEVGRTLVRSLPTMILLIHRWKNKVKLTKSSPKLLGKKWSRKSAWDNLLLFFHRLLLLKETQYFYTHIIFIKFYWTLCMKIWFHILYDCRLHNEYNGFAPTFVYESICFCYFEEKIILKFACTLAHWFLGAGQKDSSEETSMSQWLNWLIRCFYLVLLLSGHQHSQQQLYFYIEGHRFSFL